MNRREFLLLRRDGTGRPTVLSCEQLYMRYVDALSDGTIRQLFAALARDLTATRTVRVTDTVWLSCEDLKRQLDEVLAEFRACGGRVVKGR